MWQFVLRSSRHREESNSEADKSEDKRHNCAIHKILRLLVQFEHTPSFLSRRNVPAAISSHEDRFQVFESYARASQAFTAAKCHRVMSGAQLSRASFRRGLFPFKQSNSRWRSCTDYPSPREAC